MIMEFQNKPMKTVTILLTRYSDAFGTFICGISKNKYSHASISIDGKEEIFYSFNYKGFVVEKPKKYKPKLRRPGSICIRMQVPEETYQEIQNEIQLFLNKKETLKYSRLGVILCLLHIPYKFENKYFCSQFVAEILAKAGAIELQKKESLYLPGQLLDGIEGCFGPKQIIYNAI